MANTKSVAKKKENLPVECDYGNDAGAGFENQTSEDYSIPFIGVLQPNSPQVDERDDCSAGDIFNSATESAVQELPFIPSITQHIFCEWIPRDEGGGLVGRHEIDSDVVKQAKQESEEFGQYKMPNGNDLIETFYVYGVAVTEDGPQQAVISFKSTGIKRYKNWMTKARGVSIEIPSGGRVRPPLFAHRYLLTALKEKKGSDTFYNFQIAWDGEKASDCRLTTDDPIYQMARDTRDMVMEGTATADVKSETATQGSGPDPEAPDDEIPF